LKEEALDRTKWTAHFGRGFGLIVMKKYCLESMNRGISYTK